MAYHKDGFIHSVPDEVLSDLTIVLACLANHTTPDQVTDSAARLEKYVRDYKEGELLAKEETV